MQGVYVWKNVNEPHFFSNKQIRQIYMRKAVIQTMKFSHQCSVISGRVMQFHCMALLIHILTRKAMKILDFMSLVLPWMM